MEKLIKESGCKKTDIAREIGISISTLKRWIDNPNANQIERVKKAIGNIKGKKIYKVTLRMDEEIYGKLSYTADKEGKTVSEVIRECLNQVMK